jgi:hypothetical protein
MTSGGPKGLRFSLSGSALYLTANAILASGHPPLRETVRFIEVMGLCCNQSDLTFAGCYLPDIFPLSVRIVTGLQCCRRATVNTETKRIAFLGKPIGQNPLSRDSHLKHIRDEPHLNLLKRN